MSSTRLIFFLSTQYRFKFSCLLYYTGSEDWDFQEIAREMGKENRFMENVSYRERFGIPGVV